MHRSLNVRPVPGYLTCSGPVRRAVLALGVAVLAAGVVGCGSSSAPSPSTSVDLQVTLHPEGPSGPAQTWTVTCPSSTHTSACAALVADKAAFTPHDPKSACTMIYGGPETLTVTGHVGSRQINYTTGRGNGCEIADYSRDLALVAPFRTAS